MGNYNEFFNELIERDTELKKEVDLLELKYLLIETLLSYRKFNRLSQTEFAKQVGVKQQVISRFEKGEVDPRLSFVSKIILGMEKKISIANQDYIDTKQKVKIIKLRKKAPVISKMNYIEFDKVI